jgi:hypothetical protein
MTRRTATPLQPAPPEATPPHLQVLTQIVPHFLVRNAEGEVDCDVEGAVKLTVRLVDTLAKHLANGPGEPSPVN